MLHIWQSMKICTSSPMPLLPPTTTTCLSSMMLAVVFCIFIFLMIETDDPRMLAFRGQTFLNADIFLPSMLTSVRMNGLPLSRQRHKLTGATAPMQIAHKNSNDVHVALIDFLSDALLVESHSGCRESGSYRSLGS